MSSNIKEQKRRERPVHGCYQLAFRSDARITRLPPKSIDVIVTSPAYWQKRDYGHKKQIGLEKTSDQYIDSIISVIENWKSCLKPTGSVFLNVGDSYSNGRLLEIPSRIAAEATKLGWKLRQRIIWEKPNGTPHSANRRLAAREEYVFHFTRSDKYYFDLEGYKQKYGGVSNIWRISPSLHKGEHLAPFPEELVERILTLACPIAVCSKCGQPYERVVAKTALLDESRPQAKRAMAIAREAGLSDAHIAAIQAVGISDAGKAIRYQNGAGKNGAGVQKLAAEAKKVLGGYFREFTFAKKQTVSWRRCSCNAAAEPGVIFDPFVGTGTSLRAASKLGVSAIGSDIKFYKHLKDFFALE